MGHVESFNVNCRRPPASALSHHQRSLGQSQVDQTEKPAVSTKEDWDGQ